MTVQDAVFRLRGKMLEGQEKLSERQIALLYVAAETMLELRDEAYNEGRANMAAVIRNAIEDSK
jgi:hypothetical protein